MRRRWGHVTPEETQPTPRDNTARHVYAQVSRWLRTDVLVHPEIAMEIAAWWQGPGRLDTAITAFSHSGAIKIHGIGGWDGAAGLGPDLGDAVRELIARRVARHRDEDSDYLTATLALRALSAYVDAVEQHYTRYRRSIWHGGGHRWMSTDTVDEGSCLTCGVHGRLAPDSADGDYGSYHGGDGELIDACTGETDLVHGIERHCEADGGRGCADDQLTGTCRHTAHECNCLLCY